MEKYKYYLHRLPNIGDRSIEKLLKVFGTPEIIYKEALKENPELINLLNVDAHFMHRGEKAVEFTRKCNPEKDYEAMLNQNIRFISKDDEEFPERLNILSPVPYAIYVKGSIPENTVPAIAVIGARQCSEYGTFVANAFGEALASSNINIISGMARGVDGISQRGALNVNGKTYAVLGSGVDVCYPLCNFKLYNEIQQNGGILSLFPPGTEPKKSLFPERNKVVAALSDLVLVIEARLKSGTSITIDLAMNMGKEIYAVPGRLTDRLSDGCNLLIRDGAGVALSPEDIIRELTLIWNRRYPEDNSMSQNTIGFVNKFKPPKDEGLMKYLDINPISIDEIHSKRLLDEPNCSISNTMSELIGLCLEEKAIQVGSNFFQKKMT